jgi:hypothetical protein
LNFRGRADGGNVLAGKRLVPTLRRYGRLDCCLTPACTSCAKEPEVAQPFFAGDVSPSTVTLWVVGCRTTLVSDVDPLGATRRRGSDEACPPCRVGFPDVAIEPIIHPLSEHSRAIANVGKHIVSARIVGHQPPRLTSW